MKGFLFYLIFISIRSMLLATDSLTWYSTLSYSGSIRTQKVLNVPQGFNQPRLTQQYVSIGCGLLHKRFVAEYQTGFIIRNYDLGLYGLINKQHLWSNKLALGVLGLEKNLGYFGVLGFTEKLSGTRTVYQGFEPNIEISKFKLSGYRIGGQFVYGKSLTKHLGLELRINTAYQKWHMQAFKSDPFTKEKGLLYHTIIIRYKL